MEKIVGGVLFFGREISGSGFESGPRFRASSILTNGTDGEDRRNRAMETIAERIIREGYNGLAEMVIDSEEVIMQNPDGSYSYLRDTFVYDIRGKLIRKVA